MLKRSIKNSGLVWGFSFLQYCWEDEFVFYAENCKEDPGYECFNSCKTNQSYSNESGLSYLSCAEKACYLKHYSKTLNYISF